MVAIGTRLMFFFFFVDQSQGTESKGSCVTKIKKTRLIQLYRAVHNPYVQDDQDCI